MITDQHDPHRQPKRGDKIVAAPFGENCVAGEVVSLRAGRVILKTSDHGQLTLPSTRFTWKPKARHWVCWPADMDRFLAVYDKADAAQARARFGLKPQVGDMTMIDGKIGWITRLYSRPLKASASLGMTFSTFGGYEVTLFGRDDKLKVEADDLVFEPVERVWTTRTTPQA